LQAGRVPEMIEIAEKVLDLEPHHRSTARADPAARRNGCVGTIRARAPRPCAAWPDGARGQQHAQEIAHQAYVAKLRATQSRSPAKPGIGGVPCIKFPNTSNRTCPPHGGAPNARLPFAKPPSPRDRFPARRVRRASIDAAIAIDMLRLRPRFALAPPRAILRGFRQCDIGFLLVRYALYRTCAIGRPPRRNIEESETCRKPPRAPLTAGGDLG
jgi:hypothetical protein